MRGLAAASLAQTYYRKYQGLSVASPMLCSFNLIGLKMKTVKGSQHQ